MQYNQLKVNPMGQLLGEMLDLENKQRPVKLARSRVMAKACVLLFRELVKEICS